MSVLPGRALAQAGGTSSVQYRNENFTVTLGGRIHRMIQIVGDGANVTRLFTDAEQGPTTLRTGVTGQPSDVLTLGATLEIGLQQNRPFKVSQDAPDGGMDVTGRIVEVYLQSTKVGKFSLGRGFAASWLASEIDLSTTQFASLLPVGMLSPGLKFVDRSTDSLSGVQVFVHFADVERLLIQDRLRYDSPQFAGIQLSGTIAADERVDAAVRTRHAPGGFTVVGGSSYAANPFEGIDWRWDAVVSVRHEVTGLNATSGFVFERLTRAGNADAKTFLVKLGWLTDLVSLGKTAFAVDFYQNRDVRLDGDKGTSFGLFAMQKWPAYGLDFYVGVRRYDVGRSDIDLKPLVVVPLGVALSF